ncbi:hypothetical protein [Vampirovibrio sp.]|uniref:hypothetical protein n=1 Tax=Vampirovibrio sp. TaxID=2717857 RepID=UPI0035946C40
MSIGVKTWGNVVFRYPKSQFKPKQIEEALEGLSKSLQPEKPAQIDLSKQNGLNTVTIIESHTRNPIVFQQGRYSTPTSLLTTALNRIQAIRSGPTLQKPLPHARLKRLPQQDVFHQRIAGQAEEKVHYFDPVRPSDY